MPRKRRDKKISLTKTSKKGLQGKHKLVDVIRDCVDNYKQIMVFSFDNMRNDKMQEIKLELRNSSRFFLGKNKVMSLALGRTSAEEVDENLHLLSDKLIGQRGLCFTNKTKDEMLEYFDALKSPAYARAGNKCTETVELAEGPLAQFSHTLEPTLRQLGLPTKLDRGIPTLLKSHTICKKNELLNPEQCKLLKHFGLQQAYFHITFEFVWTKDGGSFDDLGRVKQNKDKVKKRGVKHTKRKKKVAEKQTSDGEDVTEDVQIKDSIEMEDNGEDGNQMEGDEE